MLESTYQIKTIQGHFEAYDTNNKFVMSGDTEQEIIDDLTELIISQTKLSLGIVS